MKKTAKKAQNGLYLTMPKGIVLPERLRKVLKAGGWILLSLSIALILDALNVLKATPEVTGVINIAIVALRQLLSYAISESGILSDKE